MPPVVTTSQIGILRHSLGLDEHGNGHTYRNHFVTGPGSTDYDDCRALVQAGYMRKHRASPITGGDPWFSVTDEGRAAARGGQA